MATRRQIQRRVAGSPRRRVLFHPLLIMLLAIAWVVLGLWILLLIQELLNLASFPSLDSSAVPSELPFVSIIVPARNEADVIEISVRGWLAQQYPAFEVIVTDDQSTDETPQILARLAAHDDRLIVITGKEPPAGWLGKPWAQHQGASVARGDLLLFADADLHYLPPALRSYVAFFLERAVGAVSVFPRFQMQGFWENLFMPILAVVGTLKPPLWLAQRSSVPRLGMGGGPGTLLRRDLYASIGGHQSLRNAVVDDVGLVHHVRRAGRGSMFVNADHLVSLRMYRGLRGIVEGFTKNLAVAFGNNLAIIALVILLCVAVHLLPYVLAIVAAVQWALRQPVAPAALLGLMTVAVITVARVLLFARFGYRLDSALFGHPLMFGVFLYILMRSTWHVVIGRKLDWRGRRYSSWAAFGGEDE